MAKKATKTSTPKPAKVADVSHKPTWTEQIHVRGDELVACVKRLAAEGQVKRIRVIEPDGDIMLEMPLTIGAIAGGAVILAAPARRPWRLGCVRGRGEGRGRQRHGTCQKGMTAPRRVLVLAHEATDCERIASWSFLN